MNYQELPTSDLIARLRRAASIWFKNDDLLLVEELIHATSAATRRPRHTAANPRVLELRAVQNHRETPSCSQGSPLSIILASNLRTGAEYASLCSYPA